MNYLKDVFFWTVCKWLSLYCVCIYVVFTNDIQQRWSLSMYFFGGTYIVCLSREKTRPPPRNKWPKPSESDPSTCNHMSRRKPSEPTRWLTTRRRVPSTTEYIGGGFLKGSPTAGLPRGLGGHQGSGDRKEPEGLDKYLDTILNPKSAWLGPG